MLKKLSKIQDDLNYYMEWEIKFNLTDNAFVFSDLINQFFSEIWDSALSKIFQLDLSFLVIDVFQKMFFMVKRFIHSFSFHKVYV